MHSGVLLCARVTPQVSKRAALQLSNSSTSIQPFSLLLLQIVVILSISFASFGLSSRAETDMDDDNKCGDAGNIIILPWR